MKPIIFDVKYWSGLGGTQPMRVAEVTGEVFIEKLKELLRDPTIQGVQVTIEKEHGQEFF